MIRACQAAFTLVEIMIVVVIIGLLATMAISAFGRIREKSENTTIANDLRTFSAAFEQYGLARGHGDGGGASRHGGPHQSR